MSQTQLSNFHFQGLGQWQRASHYAWGFPSERNTVKQAYDNHVGPKELTISKMHHAVSGLLAFAHLLHLAQLNDLADFY